MPNIFISYRRADTQWFSKFLATKLQEVYPDEVFFDVATIHPGQNFPDIIKTALRNCDVVIIVIGKDWLDSADENGQRRLDNPDDWVRLEVIEALHQEITVIPVLVDHKSTLNKKDLPHEMQGLVDLNHISIDTNTFDMQFNELLTVIENPNTKNLRRLFQVWQPDPQITLYLPGHKAESQSALFRMIDEDPPFSERLSNLKNLQGMIDKNEIYSSLRTREIDLVATLTMLSALRLKDFIEQSQFTQFLSQNVQFTLPKGIQANLFICPQTLDEIEKEKPLIIIGGRSNQVTLYLLYELNAGLIRPGLLNRNHKEEAHNVVFQSAEGGFALYKNQLEFIGGYIPNKILQCKYDDKNFAILQRFQLEDDDWQQTIFYLLGTGVNGTVACIAYLRQNWQKIIHQFGNDNFAIVLETARQTSSKNNLSQDIERIDTWTSEDWIEVFWCQEKSNGEIQYNINLEGDWLATID